MTKVKLVYTATLTHTTAWNHELKQTPSWYTSTLKFPAVEGRVTSAIGRNRKCGNCPILLYQTNNPLLNLVWQEMHKILQNNWLGEQVQPCTTHWQSYGDQKHFKRHGKWPLDHTFKVKGVMIFWQLARWAANTTFCQSMDPFVLSYLSIHPFTYSFISIYPFIHSPFHHFHQSIQSCIHAVFCPSIPVGKTAPDVIPTFFSKSN